MVKILPANAGDVGSVPSSGGSPRGGKSNPLQCSCLKNSMNKGAWWATVHGVKKHNTNEQLGTRACMDHVSLSSPPGVIQ